MKDLFRVRKRITIIWLIAAGLLFLYLIALTGSHPDLAKAAGSWYSTSVMPATGVIIGLWLAVARTGTQKERVQSTAASLAEAFIYFYVFCLLVPLVVFVGFTGMAFEAYFDLSQIWLALLQTPTLAFLGKIFAAKNDAESPQ